MWVNAIAIILYLFTVGYLLRTHREYLILIGLLAFEATWQLASCFYNDLGIYNLELFRFTEPTHATARLAIFFIVFNLGFFCTARIIGNRKLARVDYSFSKETLFLGHLKFYVYTAVVLFVLYALYSLITKGIPVLSGMDRYALFQQFTPLQKKVVIYGTLISFLLGYFRVKRGRFSVNGLLMAFFVIYAISHGHKFSFLILIFATYFVPIYTRYLAQHSNLRLFTRRQILTATAIVVLLGIFVFGNYQFNRGDYSFAYNYMRNRILAFQGEIWWAVDNDIQKHGRYDADHLQTEWQSIVSPEKTEEGSVGLKYLMVKVIGPEKAFPIFEKGYLYTDGYPAILIATFPYLLALVVQFFAGAFFLILLYYLYYSILYQHSIRAIVTLVIILPYLAMILGGNFGTFFTTGMLFKMLFLLVLEMGSLRTANSGTVSSHSYRISK